jgi:hypothetical protein
MKTAMYVDRGHCDFARWLSAKLKIKKPPEGGEDANYFLRLQQCGYNRAFTATFFYNNVLFQQDFLHQCFLHQCSLHQRSLHQRFYNKAFTRAA